MDRAGCQSSHPFQNNASANDSPLTSTSFYNRISFLSHFLTPQEIIELSHQLQSCPEPELYRLATNCHRQSVSLSESERSSYLSNLSSWSLRSSSSIHSHDSFATDTCAVEQPTPEPGHRWPEVYAGSPPEGQLASLQNSFPPSRPVLQNQEPPYPTQVLQINKPFCFACNEHFKNKGSLKRHQQEQCEREKIAACSLCPAKQGIYYTKERLFRHHLKSHGDKCRNGCSKKVSDLCKEHLSNSFEALPPKKAWGCPYCVSCFKTFEEWNGHCIDHLTKADKAPNWSFGMMIWSLLQQESLREARNHHDMPGGSCWSSLNEKMCSGLREVLERCKLPPGFGGREYWYLNESYAVVRCVFHHIRTGQGFPSQQLFEVRSKPMPVNAGESSKVFHSTFDSVLERGNADWALKMSPFSQPRAESEIATPCSVQTTNPATQPPASATVEIIGDFKARPVDTQNEDDTGRNQTRRRGASLKRSLSSLALRPSSTKSPAIQATAIPPVPALPRDSRASAADKIGAGTHQDRSWSAPFFLDPIPQHMPMSGIVYGWSWPECRAD